LQYDIMRSMAASEKSTLLQDVVRGGVWGGIIAGLRIASLSLFSLATANFLAGGAIIGAAVVGVMGLLNRALNSPPA